MDKAHKNNALKKQHNLDAHMENNINRGKLYFVLSIGNNKLRTLQYPNVFEKNIQIDKRKLLLKNVSFDYIRPTLKVDQSHFFKITLVLS